jgi:5-methylthioadenosine/S-adenosylhomocysteine deaminase
VLPGLVDAHVHAWEGQLRGLAPAVDLTTYMDVTHAGYGPHYTPDDVHIGTLVTALLALDGGVTTMIDNAHNSRTFEHGVAAIDGLRDAGIRGVHADGVPPFSGFDTQEWLRNVDKLRNSYLASQDGLVTLRLMDAAPESDVWRYARDNDLWVTTEMGSHVTNLPDLAAEGLLTAHHTFNHCINLPDRDWQLIADAGATVNLCTRSDAHFGLGQYVPPVDEAVRFGLIPGLSTDNEVSYSGDMFIEMQHLVAVHRGRTAVQQFAGDSGAQHLSLRDVLSFATLGGAANAGLAGTTGSLTPGMQADIILVRTSDTSTALVDNAYAALVGFATRANVDSVFVAGKARKWAGALTEHNLEQVIAAAAESRVRLMTARGLRRDPFAPHGSVSVAEARPSAERA